MAISFVKEVGHAIPLSPGASYALAITSAPNAGDLVVLSVAAHDPSVSGETASSVTDSKGNTWTVNNSNVSGVSGVAVSVASTVQDVGNLTTSDTITIHLSASTADALAVVAHEFSGCTNSVDQTATGTATSTSRTAGTTPTTTNASDLIFGCFSVNGGDSSFSAGSGYTTPSPSFYANSTNVTVEVLWQIVSATGAYNPNGTGSGTFNSMGVAVAYKGIAVTQTPLFVHLPFQNI